MEDVMEMEVEESASVPVSSNSFSKRFGLKNSIQTNFGDDYVFQIVPKDDWTSMAVSLSTNVVKLYSSATSQFVGELKGHSSTINEISFADSTNPHVLYSCSSDATVRAWDTRSFQQVFCVNAGPSQEVFSFSLGGLGQNLLAAGCKSQILFWDSRNKKQVACLEESHMDDVTQVHFIPDNQSKLVSASMDGLMCIFDTAGDINDEDHLDSVMNVGTSVGRVGFCGETNEKLWCLTHIETFSIWDWKDGRLETNFEDARTLASNSWRLGPVDYFIDCHYSAEDDNLWVIGGTNGGTIGYFPVKYRGTRGILAPEAVLDGGHSDVVRSVVPARVGPIQSQGVFGWTGGEDGRLCCWFSDKNCDVSSRSWISSALALKSPKIRKKNRHQPY